MFVGCSDVDMHIPAVRVRESAQVIADLNGSVMERIYPGMGQTITEEELAEANRHLFAGNGR